MNVVFVAEITQLVSVAMVSPTLANGSTFAVIFAAKDLLVPSRIAKETIFAQFASAPSIFAVFVAVTLKLATVVIGFPLPASSMMIVVFAEV